MMRIAWLVVVVLAACQREQVVAHDPRIAEVVDGLVIGTIGTW